MVLYTVILGKFTVAVIQMLTGEETLTTGSPHPAMYLKLLEDQSVGKAVSRVVWHYQQPRQSILLWLPLLKSYLVESSPS